MLGIELDLAKLTAYLLPMYITNASAVFFSGRTPLDLGIQLSDGRRLLGNGKTAQGTFGSLLAGIFVSLLLSIIYPELNIVFGGSYFQLGILLSVGTVLGDLVASFLKRRMGMESGQEFILLDQLDFVAGAILLGTWIYIPSWVEIAVIAIATLLIHRASNWFAYKIKLKKVPW